jgi:hypothetical protein
MARPIKCVPNTSREAEVARPVQRRAKGWTAWIQFLEGTTDFSLFHNVQIGSGPHPVSYTTGSWATFPGGKAAGA